MTLCLCASARCSRSRKASSSSRKRTKRNPINKLCRYLTRCRGANRSASANIKSNTARCHDDPSHCSQLSPTAPPPYRAPHDPARVPEIVAALKKVSSSPRLARVGVRVAGQPRYRSVCRIRRGRTSVKASLPCKMIILLQGEIYVRREHGGPAALFIGRSGQITGLLPFSRMKAYGGLGYTSAASWWLEFDRSLFPEMVKTIPAITERVVGHSPGSRARNHTHGAAVRKVERSG